MPSQNRVPGVRHSGIQSIRLQIKMLQEAPYKQFEQANEIVEDRTIYHFDQEEVNKLADDKPWDSQPDYFTNCKISVNALTKMLIHACLGKTNEVMGILQGRIEKQTFIIFDVIQIHAQANETTVQLTNESTADMTATLDQLEKVGRVQSAVGWYHSHPSYGCWLSGIDVETQELQQQAYGAFVAVVIDPVRSIANNKIDVGAFRVYPRDYKPPVSLEEQSTLIPNYKIKEFGAHHDRYYPLKTTFFSNSADRVILESLWKQYWGVRLAASSFWGQQEYFTSYMNDLKEKCCRHKVASGKQQQQQLNQSQGGQQATKTSQEQYPKDLIAYTLEYSQAIMSESLKGMIFS